MKVIKTKEDQINDVMNIINQAKKYFKNNSINQWQDGYPNEDSILNDINNNKSQVLIDNNQVLGTMYFAIEDDPTYHYIDGSWISQKPYAVIHRIAIDEKIKGQNIAYELVKYAILQCKENYIQSIRIDTHRDNLSMQSFLKKHGFILCGIIYLSNGDERLAFEKIIE